MQDPLLKLPFFYWSLVSTYSGRTCNSDEVQLYNAIQYAVGNIHEALKIVTVSGRYRTDTKGSKALKFLQQRCDHISESKVQRCLMHIIEEEAITNLWPLIYRTIKFSIKNTKILGHSHTERNAASSMVDG